MGKTVEELLGSVSSRELTEWYAYELVYGPIGDGWRDEAIAAMQEQLQLLNHLFSQANFTDKHHRKGPVPKPERYPRPEDAFKQYVKEEKPDEDNDDSDDEEGWVIPRTFGSRDDKDE